MPRSNRPERHYFYRGEVERFRSSSRGYVRFPGYSANGASGPLAPWMTWTEVQTEAKRDQVKAVFHREA